MRIGYGQVTIVSWGLAGGAGAQFLTDDGALTDGNPGRVTRFQWRDDGSPSTAHFVALQGEFEEGVPVGLVALLGTTLPPGTRLEVRGRRATDAGYPYDLGGNSMTQVIVELDDGSHAAIWALPADNDPLVGIEARIYNDDGSGPWADADTYWDIGQFVVMRSVDVAAERGWAVRAMDPSVASRTVGGQLDVVRRRGWRVLDIRIVPQALAKVRGGGLGNGMDLQRLEAALRGKARCLAVPRWRNPADGTVNAEELHRTAVYGVTRPAPIDHRAGPWYQSAFQFEEVPPR